MVMQMKAPAPDVRKMHHLLECSNEYIVLDLETTGFSPKTGGRIIEIGACKVRNGKIVETFSELIDPEMKVSAKITEVTGITNEMVKGKRYYGQSLPQLYHWMEGLPVVCHNATFDWKTFLLHYFEAVGIHAVNEVICTLKLAKHYLPSMGSYKLNVLSDHFGVSLESHHRALDDAKATAAIASILQARFTNPNNRNQRAPETFVYNCISPDAYKILHVAYWEKKASTTLTMQRVYVQTTIGSVYYDIVHNAWYAPDMPDSVDFLEMEQRVLQFARLQTREQLRQFRKSVS